MTVSFRIEPNREGIRKFLQDLRGNQKMWGVLEQEGHKIAKRAGPGFKVDKMTGRLNRPGVRVTAATRHAKNAQLKDNRLGRAVGGEG